jgi:hypothetical protein
MVCVLAAGIAGCGGARQDADEPAGTYQLSVVRAQFPTRQHVAAQSRMRIVVRNNGRKTVPVVAVTVRGFEYNAQQAGLADASRPNWIIDDGPRGGDSAYVDTWTLGSLPGGATRTFEWTVTPVVAGLHNVRYELAAGLDDKAKVARTNGHAPGGAFRVQVSGRPANATVDPGTGQVIRR